MRALPRRERRLEGRGRRWRETVTRFVSHVVPGGRWTKKQQSSLVEIGGSKLKRIAFPDTASAARAEALTRRAWRVDAAPEPVCLDGSDLWLDYLDGAPVASDDASFVPLLAGLFCALWSTGTRAEDPHQSGRVSQVARDLRWLSETGVLDASLCQALERGPLKTAPPELYCGLDYVDPRPENFVSRDGGLWIIDVESLSEDFPLGSGLAKATLRWPEARRDAMIAELAARGGPDLSAQLPFVELAFLSGWQKRCVLRGKWKLVDPALFRRHLLD